MIDSAGVPLKAMLLLGINCGMGQSDIANLPKSHVDLERGWLDSPRRKTGVDDVDLFGLRRSQRCVWRSRNDLSRKTTQTTT